MVKMVHIMLCVHTKTLTKKKKNVFDILCCMKYTV